MWGIEGVYVITCDAVGTEKTQRAPIANKNNGADCKTPQCER